MQTNVIKQLQELKNKLDNQKMSVLVGAGFSKNVSNIFPNWSDLLYDMVYYLFKDDIEERFWSINFMKRISLNKKKFIEDKISYYIESIGYLEIVSLYLKRKGHREAVTAYIEEKTPQIVGEDEKCFLTNKLKGKANRIELNNSMLSLHRKLVNIPWNNIYTTNYDEMLDTVVDKQTIENIEKEKSEIEKENDSLLEEITQLELEIETQEKSFNEDRVKVGKNKILWRNLVNEFSVIMDEDKDDSHFQDIYKKLNQNRGELSTKKNLLKSRKELYQSLEKAKNKHLTIVKSSNQLGVKRNNNLIKLHGSIRNNNEKYGFDGDLKKQYIIAQEDYETYPVKHEAFTQLMRISLLQESFCLIGFSGDDPNFIEWVKWVRDVLDKGKKAKDEYKIYLIDVSPSDVLISKDRKLFYSNHSIFRIPLMNKEVIRFLEDETKKNLSASKKNPRNAIDLFLNYLNKNCDINTSSAIFESLQIKKYNKLWDDINIPFHEKIDIAPPIKNIKLIASLQKYNRFPSTSFINSSNRIRVFHRSKELIEKATSIEQKEHLIELILIAYQDVFLPISDDFEELANSIPVNQELECKLELFLIRKQILEGILEESISYLEDKNLKTNEEYYELILALAFSFNFKKLKEQLNKWKTKGYWSIKKAGFLALYNPNEASKLIEVELENFEYSKEKLYAYQLLHYIRQNINYGKNRDLYDIIELYKNENLKDIFYNFDYIIDSLKPKPEKIKPYGQDRFSITNDYSFSSGLTDYGLAIQFIQILIEGGFPLSLPRVHLKSHDVTFSVFKLLFEKYPYPALFYFMQYSNEGFLKRVGQEYAYSDSLKGDLPQIIVQLLEAYINEDTPPMFKRGIISLSSELFIAVDPKYWESLFIDIWLDEKFQKNAYLDNRNPEKSWINSALPYLQKKESIQSIISATLENSNHNNAIGFLYTLGENRLLKEFGSDIQTKDIEEQLKKLMHSVATQESAWFIIGNSYDILNETQKKEVQEIIRRYDYNTIENERLWRIFVALAEDEVLDEKKFKEGILSSKKLWDTGFHSDGSLSGIGNYIELSRFSKSIHNLKGITWVKEETKKIFKKLEEELIKIEHFLNKRPDHNFRFILSEMLLFLKAESNSLKDNKLYEEVFTKVKELHIKDRGYKDLAMGLSSSDKSIVVWALSELSNEIWISNTNECIKVGLAILLNKVFLQTDPAIEASLKYLSTWVSDEKNKDIFIAYEQTLVMILKKYKEQELKECDKPFVLEHLIRIAVALEKWGIKEEVIQIYLDKKTNSKYNNIKYGLV